MERNSLLLSRYVFGLSIHKTVRKQPTHLKQIGVWIFTAPCLLLVMPSVLLSHSEKKNKEHTVLSAALAQDQVLVALATPLVQAQAFEGRGVD